MNKIAIITISLLFILQGCYSSYQPKVVDRIVQPFSKEIKTFYLKNNRYPDNYELNRILNKIKWREITVSNDYDCNGYKCHISTLYADKKSVEIQITHNNTICNYFFENKNLEKKCYEKKVIPFKQ